MLHAVTPEPIPADAERGVYLREVARRGDIEQADRTFAAMAKGPIGEAYNHLQFAVEDEVDVHRVVLAWRAWDTLDLAGPEWAEVLLRQSIRYCAHTEHQMIDRNQARSPIRTVLPSLLEQYNLPGPSLGQKPGDDAWLRELATVIFKSPRPEAAEAVAKALHEGYSPESIGEAISLASNMLALHDPGRLEQWASPEKPAGSCHGDSVGVHASDAANAWRNIVRVSNPRNAAASLIVGAFHTAGQSERSNKEPYPLPEQLAEVKSEDAAALLHEADSAIHAKDQIRAAAVISRYCELGHDPRPVFDLMLGFATSEDGALHAEKYYRTVSAEYATMRPPFRKGQLVALARVTASEYGQKSMGYEEAKKRLSV